MRSILRSFDLSAYRVHPQQGCICRFADPISRVKKVKESTVLRTYFFAQMDTCRSSKMVGNGTTDGLKDPSCESWLPLVWPAAVVYLDAKHGIKYQFSQVKSEAIGENISFDLCSMGIIVAMLAITSS